LEDFSRNGLGMALVYQNVTTDWQGSYNGGRYNAQLGRNHATDIGFPGDRPIYMAVDRDIVTEAEYATVMSYLDGAASVLGGPKNVGVYGEAEVIRRALEGGHASYGWQTAAWSKGARYGGAHLYQYVGTVVINGIACDYNDVLKPDWGQHNYLEDDMSWDERFRTPDGKDIMARDLLVWTNYFANQIPALLATMTRIADGEAMSTEDIKEVISTSAQEAFAQTIIPMLRESLPDVIEEAMAGDNTATAAEVADQVIGRMADRLAASLAPTE
jgi:hypothetical protein